MLVWDVTGRKQVCEIDAPDPRFQITALAFSHDGKRVAIGAGYEVTVHDRATGKQVKRLDLTHRIGTPTFLGFTPRDEGLVIAGRGLGAALAVWEVNADVLHGEFPKAEFRKPVRGVKTPATMHRFGVLSPDGRVLATVTSESRPAAGGTLPEIKEQGRQSRRNQEVNRRSSPRKNSVTGD